MTTGSAAVATTNVESKRLETLEDLPAANDVLKPELPTFQPGLPQSDTVPPTAVPAGGGTEARESTGAQASDTLIVSSEKPADVAASQWASSLTAALQRAAVDVNWNVVEVRGRHQLEEPIVFRDRELQIRGGASAAIEITERVVADQQVGEGLFDLQNSNVTFSSLSIDVLMPSETLVAKQGLFRVRGTSEIELNACTVTVRASTAELPLPSVAV